MHFELIEFEDGVDHLMCRPALFRRHFHVAANVRFEEGRRWQAAPQVGDPIGVFKENIGSQPPIVGMQRRVDGNAADDEGPKRHEFENMIEHRDFSFFRANSLSPLTTS
jgi:hypothetical protein